MATGKTPDPRKRKTSHPHASNLKVPNGSKELGYLAGEMYGCYTHQVGNAHPCVADITDDALECQYCTLKKPVTWRGYVPIWDADWTLRYALIGEDIFESVNALRWHASVVVSRAKNPISPLIIREADNPLRTLPNKAPYNTCIYALRVCLTLWQDSLLTAWCQEHASLALGASPTTVKPTPELGYKGPAPADDGEEIGVLANRIMGKVKALPSGNGKHQAPPKG
jgi:hypothetical protein